MLLQRWERLRGEGLQFSILQLLRGRLELLNMFLMVLHRVLRKRLVKLLALEPLQMFKRAFMFSGRLTWQCYAFLGSDLSEFLIRFRMILNHLLTQCFHGSTLTFFSRQLAHLHFCQAAGCCLGHEFLVLLA